MDEALDAAAGPPCAGWASPACHLFDLRPNVTAISGAPLVYELHANIAWAFCALFPFSRFVHAWSTRCSTRAPVDPYRRRDLAVR